MSGEGFVLNKEDWRRFIDIFKIDRCIYSVFIEDLVLGRCMEIINIDLEDFSDFIGKEIFYFFGLEFRLIKGYLIRIFWYWDYNYYFFEWVLVFVLIL